MARTLLVFLLCLAPASAVAATATMTLQQGLDGSGGCADTYLRRDDTAANFDSAQGLLLLFQRYST